MANPDPIVAKQHRALHGLWWAFAVVVLLLLSVGFGEYIRLEMKTAAIEQSGGQVMYWNHSPRWMYWIFEVLSADADHIPFFDEPSGVDVYDPRSFGDRELPKLATAINNFGGIKSVGLDGTHVTDAGVTELVRIPSLQAIHLERTRVTEDGVQVLKDAFPGIRVFK